MIELMNDLTKKALEYSLSLCILLGGLYYQTDRIGKQDEKMESMNDRLQSCEMDKLHLSTQVAEFKGQIQILTDMVANRPSTRKSK